MPDFTPNAAALDGAADAFDAGNDAVLQATTALTVTAKAKFDSLDTDQHIVSKSSMVEAVPNEIFPTNAINLNEVDEYLELTDSTKLGFDSPDYLISSGWVTGGSGTRQYIYTKGQYVNDSDRVVEVKKNDNDTVTISYTIKLSGTVRHQIYTTTATVPNGPCHLLVCDPKTSSTSIPIIYFNAVDSSAGAWANQNGLDRTTINWDDPRSFKLGRVTYSSGTHDYFSAGTFVGVGFSQIPTQANATALYNGGTPLCWDLMEQSEKDLFDNGEFFDNATWAGRTELQALTGHVNGWVLDNINDAPFDLAGLDVECEPYPYEIFAGTAMNAINAAGVLEVTDDNNRYNIGTGGFGVSAWVYATATRPTVSLFDKYNKQSFDQWIQFGYGSSGITMNYGYNPGHLDQEFSFGNPYVQNQWVHVLVWFPRTSRYATPTLFLDGVEFIGGSWTVDDADVSIINFNALPRLAQGRTIITSGTISNRGVPAMWGILNSEPTQADATALHNAGNPLCWDLMEDVQKDKFDGFYETLMYDVKTEEEARTDKVNGYIMGNKWGSPFDLTGLDIECEPYPYEIFPTNAINTNQVDEYLRITDKSKLNLGTQTMSSASRFIYDGSDVMICSKFWSQPGANRQSGYFLKLEGSVVRFVLNHISSGNIFLGTNIFEIPHGLSNGEHTIVFTWLRLNSTDKPLVWADGVALTGGSWTQQEITNPHLVDFTSTTIQFRVGAYQGGTEMFGQAPAITGVTSNDPLDVDDAVLFHNGGQAQCWDLMDQDLRDKFSGGAYWELATWTGRSELQARTSRLGSLVLDPVNAPDFDLTGLDIECESIVVPTTISANVASFSGASLSAGDSLDPLTADFGGSLWFKYTTALTGLQMLMSKSLYATPFSKMDVGVWSDDKILFRCAVNDTNKREYTAYGLTIGDGEWHHLVWFWDRSAGTCVAKLDNSSITLSAGSTPGTITGSMNNNEDFKLGNHSEGSLFFTGEMTEVQFAIGADPTLVSDDLYNGGAIPCFGILEQTTKDVFTASWSLSNSEGDIGNEKADRIGSFDLVGGTVFTGTAELDCGEDITYIDLGYHLWYDTSASKVKFSVSENGTEMVSVSAGSISTGVVYDFTGTYDGTDLKLYKNGAEVDTIAYALDINNCAENLTLGSSPEGSHYFDGDLSFVAVCPTAFTAGDVALYYGTGKQTCYEEIPSGVKTKLETGSMWRLAHYSSSGAAAGKLARQRLIDDHNWTVQDGGPA